MLMPIALLLAFIASDERCTKEQREGAACMLKTMQPKFMLAAGIAADWGLISNQFLRLFDRCNHDIANSYDELQDFVNTVHACFIEGGLFMKTQALPPASGGTGSTPAKSPAVPASAGGTGSTPPNSAMFITERVRKQTKEKCVFHCGSQPQVLWGAG